MRKFFLGSALFALAASVGLQAATFSFTGNFTQDDSLQYFSFTIGTPRTVEILTLSYAGGTNGAGQTIARGGFDPVVSVFTKLLNNDGELIGVSNDEGCGSGNVGQDSVTGACWDSFITLPSLNPGSYIVILSQADNLPSGGFLLDGFSRTGQGNFTGPAFLGQPGSFVDAIPSQRTSAWALDIRDADSAYIIPEPSTTGVVFLSGVALFYARRRASRRMKV